jgi:hypothetical protein
MTRKEIMEHIEAGEKITHHTFGPKQFLRLRKDGEVADEKGIIYTDSFFYHTPWQDGWSIYGQEISANAPPEAKNDFQEWMMAQGYFRADHAWFMPKNGPLATGAHLSDKLDEWKSNAPPPPKKEEI